MKNNSGFSYHGIVSVSRVYDGISKSYKSHNAGTDKLFTLFSRALVGEKITTLPSYIKVKWMYTDGAESDLTISPVATVKYTREDQATASSSTRTVAVFRSVVGYQNIAPADGTKTTGNNVKVYLVDASSNEYASSEIKIDAFSSVSKGMQIVIEWALYVENAQSSEE